MKLIACGKFATGVESKATSDSKVNVSPGSVTLDRKLAIVMKSEDIVRLYFIGQDGNLFYFYKDCYTRNLMLMTHCDTHLPLLQGEG